MRFKSDENLPVSTVSLLRQSGHDVHSVLDEDLGGADDASVLAAATRENRVLLALDKDFADIRMYPPDQLGGIVVLRPRDQTIVSIQAVISRMLPLLSGSDITGKLWVVDERRIRI